MSTRGGGKRSPTCWPLPDVLPLAPQTRWSANDPVGAPADTESPPRSAPISPFQSPQPSIPAPAVAGLPRREAMPGCAAWRCRAGPIYGRTDRLWIDNAGDAELRWRIRSGLLPA